MQSFGDFFANNRLLAPIVLLAVLVAVVAICIVLYRLMFGRRINPAGGRARQPRLGVVDAFDLDRHRQLVLVRRDNIEHLLMIGGPNDVVIETAIVRTALANGAGSGREKEAGSALQSVVMPPIMPPATQPGPGAPALNPPNGLSAALVMPPLVPGPPVAATPPPPVDAPQAPALSAGPSTGPNAQSPLGREPVLGGLPARTGPVAPAPARPTPPRQPLTPPGSPLSAPPRPAPSPAARTPPVGPPSRPLTTPTRPAPLAAPSPRPSGRDIPVPDPLDRVEATARNDDGTVPVVRPDTSLRPEPSVRTEPVPRPEPPQRPEPAPRPEPPARPEPPVRPEPPARPEPVVSIDPVTPKPRPEPVRREEPAAAKPAEAPERPQPPTPPVLRPPPPPQRSIDALESLEEEMAKLLGRPLPPPDRT